MVLLFTHSVLKPRDLEAMMYKGLEAQRISNEQIKALTRSVGALATQLTATIPASRTASRGVVAASIARSAHLRLIR